MTVINFNGLATGLDTGSMIDQLVAVEKSRETVYQQRVSDLTQHGAIVTDLTNCLNGLREKARALDTSSELKVAKVKTSDSSHFAIATSDAAIGGHTLRVTGLAASQVVSSVTYGSSAAGAAGVGSVDITTSGTTKTVAWTAADSLSDIAGRVNDANAGITASVVFDGTNYRLVATAKASGTAAASTFSVGNGLGWGAAGSIKVPAADAHFTLDGIAMTRASNLVDDALPGATLTLTAVHGAAESDTTIDLSADRDALRDKVKGLVDSYNAVAGALDTQLRYDGVAKPTSSLFGDGTLRRLQASLTKMVTDPHGGRTLAELGASIDKTGRLTFDQAKFDKALTTSPSAVEDLLVTGGLAASFSDLVEQHVRSGDGILAAKSSSFTNQIQVYQKDIDNIEDAATRLGDRLREQFNALEQAVSAMKNQSSQLTAMLG